MRASYSWVKTASSAHSLQNDHVCWMQAVGKTLQKPPQRAIEDNPYGYYGIVQGDQFCIRDLGIASKVDKRKQSSGAKCEEAGWPRPKLIKLLLHLGVAADVEEGQTPEQYWETKNKKEMCKRLHEWFAEHNLLVEGPCGVRGKKKV